MMGLFNHVRCRYPLPDAEAQDLLFQTKSMLDLQLATYEVTPDGRLIQVEQGGFDVAAEAGQPSVASDSPPARPDVANHRGELEIHTSAEQPDGSLRWYSYLLWFRDGRVADVQRGYDCGQLLPLRRAEPTP